MRHDALKGAGAEPSPALGLNNGVLRRLTEWRDEVARERTIRRQIQVLRCLGDRELRDIGLNRADIASAVRSTRLRRTHDE